MITVLGSNSMQEPLEPQMTVFLLVSQTLLAVSLLVRVEVFNVHLKFALGSFSECICSCKEWQSILNKQCFCSV